MYYQTTLVLIKIHIAYLRIDIVILRTFPFEMQTNKQTTNKINKQQTNTIFRFTFEEETFFLIQYLVYSLQYLTHT